MRYKTQPKNNPKILQESGAAQTHLKKGDADVRSLVRQHKALFQALADR